MTSYRTVLVGTDGSDTSLRAVDRAAAVAADAGASLVLACSYVPNPKQVVDEAQDTLGDAAYQVVGSSPAEQTLRTAAERARTTHDGEIATVSAAGDAADNLVRAAAEHRADLLVVGNVGLNTLSGRLLGSVPSDVSRGASCDVLIVRTER